jgi:hypothetical protein
MLKFYRGKITYNSQTRPLANYIIQLVDNILVDKHRSKKNRMLTHAKPINGSGEIISGSNDGEEESTTGLPSDETCNADYEFNKAAERRLIDHIQSVLGEVATPMDSAIVFYKYYENHTFETLIDRIMEDGYWPKYEPAIEIINRLIENDFNPSKEPEHRCTIKFVEEKIYERDPGHNTNTYDAEFLSKLFIVRTKYANEETDYRRLIRDYCKTRMSRLKDKLGDLLENIREYQSFKNHRKEQRTVKHNAILEEQFDEVPLVI